MARHLHVRPALRLWLVFAVCLAGALALLRLTEDAVRPALTGGTARVTAAVLWAMGLEGRAEGTLVSSSLYAYHVILECTGLFPAILLVCAIVAFPCRLRDKLAGAAAGLAILFGVNLVRLVSLVFVGRYLPGAFDVVHKVVWQSLMLFVAALLWMAWVGRVRGRDAARG